MTVSLKWHHSVWLLSLPKSAATDSKDVNETYLHICRRFGVVFANIADQEDGTQ